jgi:transposase-like protein
MARPTKLDREKMDIICRAMEIGATRKMAAQAAGVHVATLYAWLAKGKENDSGPFYEFHDRFKKAEALCACHDLTIISRAAQDDWRAAAWRLERRFGYTIAPQPQEEITLDASELDVKSLLNEIKSTNELIEKFSGPIIDVDEE